MARHYYIAEPYPDELIGSVLIRTARHRGIGNKNLTALLFKSRQSKIPLLLSLQLIQLAEATRLTPHELLHEHTPFRFITAFMSKEVTERIAEALISGTYGGLAVLSQSVTFGARQPRFCASCVQDDLKMFGESYWHRKHNLPFVDECHLHRLPLLQLQKSIDSFAAGCSPAECKSAPVGRILQGEVAEWLANQCHFKLDTTFRQRVEDWSTAYREIAVRRNFPSSSTGLCGKSFCAGLNAFYGAAFFENHNCSFEIDGSGWPSLMLRQHNRTEMLTAKHLIVQGYLQFGPPPRKERTSKPGRKIRNYALLDEFLHEKLEARMAREPVEGRPAAQELMAELEIWGTYRHARMQMHTTRALVNKWYEAFTKLRKRK